MRSVRWLRMRWCAVGVQWIEDRGSRIGDRGSRIVDHGSWIRDQGSGIRDQGSGVRDQGSVIMDMVQRFGLVQSLQTVGWLPSVASAPKCRAQSVQLQREQMPPAGGENYRSHCSHWNVVMNSVKVANHHLEPKPASWPNEQIRSQQQMEPPRIR